MTTPLEGELAREICQAVSDAIFVHDPETGEIIDVNETACDMYGYSQDEMRQLGIEDLSSKTPPYTQSNAVDYVQKAAGGEPQVFDWHAEDSEGDLFWVEISMRRALLHQNLYILVIVRDISERKARERELEEQRDNLEILNEVVRHDIRNDLQLITGYAELLEDHVTEDGEEYLETLQSSASNAIELTMTARDLSGVMLQSDDETEPVEVVSVLIPKSVEKRRPTQRQGTTRGDGHGRTNGVLPRNTYRG